VFLVTLDHLSPPVVEILLLFNECILFNKTSSSRINRVVRIDKLRASILGLCQPIVLYISNDYDNNSSTQDYVNPSETSNIGSSVSAPLDIGSRALIVYNTASLTLKDPKSGDLIEDSTPSAIPILGAIHTP
jgi:hypothetical protein